MICRVSMSCRRSTYHNRNRKMNSEYNYIPDNTAGQQGCCTNTKRASCSPSPCLKMTFSSFSSPLSKLWYVRRSGFILESKTLHWSTLSNNSALFNGKETPTVSQQMAALGIGTNQSSQSSHILPSLTDCHAFSPNHTHHSQNASSSIIPLLSTSQLTPTLIQAATPCCHSSPHSSPCHSHSPPHLLPSHSLQCAQLHAGVENGLHATEDHL